MMRWLVGVCLLGVGIWGCGDDAGNHGFNTHLPEPGSQFDAPPFFDAPVSDGGGDGLEGMTCGAGGPLVTPLPPGGSVSAFAPLGQSQFMGSCGGGSGGEVVYSVSVTTMLDSITFTTNTPQTMALPILYVRTQCDDPGTEVPGGCQVSNPGARAEITVPSPAMGTYYVFVDSPMAAASGIYVLKVQGTIPEGQSCDPQSGAFTCAPRHLCVERVPGQGTKCELAGCANGVDDDGDGKIDYPHDPGCRAFEDDDETDDCPSGPNCPQCGNGIDDDADGKIDYDPPTGGQSDPGCSSANDPSEIDECIPGVMVSEFDAMGQASGTTAGGADNFQASPGCGFGSSQGNDRVYHFRVDHPTKSVRAQMTADPSFFQPILYIRKNDCGSQTAEVACDGTGTSPLTAVAQSLQVGDDLFFFADGAFQGDQGSFTIQLDVRLDAGAPCTTTIPWQHCGSGLRCQSGTCVRTQCADGMDNDGDGKTDYPNDPGCTSADDNSENTDTCQTNPAGSGCPKCGNGMDDDGDGFIDYPNDPGCTDAADNDESDDCAPGPGLPSVTVTDISATGSADGSIAAGMGVFAQTTVGCGFAPGSGQEKVFLYRLPSARSSLTATTCNGTTFDSVVYVRSGSCTGAELGCNDDGSLPACGLQSYTTVTNPPAGVYFIFVDTYSTSSAGTFHLDVTTTP